MMVTLVLAAMIVALLLILSRHAARTRAKGTAGDTGFVSSDGGGGGGCDAGGDGGCGGGD